MSDVGDQLNGEESLEAYTLGGGLANPPQPATGGAELNSGKSWDGLRRSGSAMRPRPRRFQYATRSAQRSQRSSQQMNTPARKVVSAGEISAAALPRELGSAKPVSSLAGLKTARDFPNLLTRAIHDSPADRTPPGSVSATAETNSSVPPEKSAPERGAPWSIKIVLPRRSALRLAEIVQVFASLWTWTRKQVKVRPARKRLRVCESVSLGEKRFVAVIEIDGLQFLLGGASGSVTAIARLESSQKVSGLVDQELAHDLVQA